MDRQTNAQAAVSAKEPTDLNQLGKLKQKTDLSAADCTRESIVPLQPLQDILAAIVLS